MFKFNHSAAKLSELFFLIALCIANISCDNESQKANERIKVLERENTELRLKKENIDLQDHLQEIDNAKANVAYERLVNHFITDRDEEIRKAQEQIEKTQNLIIESKRTHTVVNSKDSEAPLLLDNNGKYDPLASSWLLAATFGIKDEEKHIKYLYSREYRQSWMAKRGLIE